MSRPTVLVVANDTRILRHLQDRRQKGDFVVSAPQCGGPEHFDMIIGEFQKFRKLGVLLAVVIDPFFHRQDYPEGLDLLKFLKENDTENQIPIIAVCSNEEVLDTMKNNGCTDHVLHDSDEDPDGLIFKLRKLIFRST